VIASAAVTTGLFVLAGVLVGGLVTAGIEFAFEKRRENAKVLVATRLVEAELSLAAASAEWRLEQGTWLPWNFENAHKVWHVHGAELARVLEKDEWYPVVVGIIGIDTIERRFSDYPLATPLSADDRKALESASKSFNEGANTLRRRQGLEEVD
jgi:hypothetical protein